MGKKRLVERKQERGPRGELSAYAAHDEAMSLPVAEVVRRLVGYLGATSVAAIGGVNETRAVKQWMRGDGRAPQRPHVLRFALQLASMIAAADGQMETVRAWFQGSNPHLEDEVPMLILRNRSLSDVQARMMSAARFFVTRP